MTDQLCDVSNCHIFDLASLTLKSLGVLNYNEVDVQLNAGGEYLYLQPINSWTDVSNLRKTLADIFLETIEERLISCDGKVKQMTYTVSHRLENGIDRKSYSSVLGTCWFWQKKEVKEKVYEPWITRND